MDASIGALLQQESPRASENFEGFIALRASPPGNRRRRLQPEAIQFGGLRGWGLIQGARGRAGTSDGAPYLLDLRERVVAAAAAREKGSLDPARLD